VYSRGEVGDILPWGDPDGDLEDDPADAQKNSQYNKNKQKHWHFIYNTKNTAVTLFS